MHKKRHVRISSFIFSNRSINYYAQCFSFTIFTRIHEKKFALGINYRSSFRRNSRWAHPRKCGASQHACATMKIIKCNVWLVYLSRDFLMGGKGEQGKRDKYSLTLAQVIYTVTCATRVFICTLGRRILQCMRGIRKRDKYIRIFFPRHPPLSFWFSVLSSLPIHRPKRSINVPADIFLSWK